MHDQPSVAELISAVKHFIDETAAPNLSGHAAFHARVASNVLATVLRDLAARPNNDATAVQRLQDLMNTPEIHDLEDLNELLSIRIREQDYNLMTTGLLAHLKQTAIEQLKVDQPTYSSLKDV